MLGDFRAWLTTASLAEPHAAGEVIDLTAVVGHFTALRHEVNLLTKTTRAAVEQNAETLKALQPAPKPEDRTPALLKAVIDIADSLALARKQVERGQAAIQEILEDAPIGPLPEAPPRPGYLRRMLGLTRNAEALWAFKLGRMELQRHTEQNAFLDKLAPLADGLADGYAMSLRRVENVLPRSGWKRSRARACRSTPS